MFRKILLSNIKTGQLTGAFIGMVIGMCLLLAAIQFYRDANHILNRSGDFISNDFLIINKPVTAINTLSGKSLKFSEEELEDLRQQDFVKDLSPLISSKFKVSAHGKEGMMLPDFYTELFFEALPDEYLDIPTGENWDWPGKDSVIPIVLPSDYLALYNFGFAQTQGLPQLSEALISQVLVDVRLQGQGKRDYYDGRIAGFSKRINSILVPWDFLKWANKKYGHSQDDRPSRVIIKTSDISNPKIYEYFEKHNIETTFRQSQANTFLKYVFWAETITASIIIVLSLMVFVVSFQLILTRNRDKIGLLFQLGYKWPKIRDFYIYFVIIQMLLVDLVSIAIFYILKSRISEWLAEKGFGTDYEVQIHILFYVLFLNLFIIVLNALLIQRQVRRIVGR